MRDFIKKQSLWESRCTLFGLCNESLRIFHSLSVACNARMCYGEAIRDPLFVLNSRKEFW